MQKFSKIKLFLPITFLTFLGAFLLNIQKANAGFLGNIGNDILRSLFYVLLMIAQFFTGLVGKIFSAILNFGFQNMAPIELGWTISRDIVNGFFIIGLVVIAFATILRFEQYGIKRLLPKFVIIALLINFSFVICGVIIDMSQIIANYFMNRIDSRAEKDIGQIVLAALEVNKALEGEVADDTEQMVSIGGTSPEGLAILSMVFAAAMIFVAGIALLIGAVLLIFRMGALWALMILAPFAWFFSIFPALKTHANKWWSEFTKWALFAPIYLFFIYLIIRISQETIETTLSDTATMTGITFTPMFQRIDLLFKFILLIILMLGAPQIAMSLGLKGAQVVNGRVKGAMRKTGKWARKQAVKPAKRAGLATQAAGARAGAWATARGAKLFGRLPGTKKIGRRLEARADQIKATPEELPQHKKYKAMLGTMSNESLKKEIKAARGIRRLIATKEAGRRGVLKEADKETKKKAIKSLRAYGAVDDAQAMEEKNPETLVEVDKQGKAIMPEKGSVEEQQLKANLKRASEKGYDKNYDASTFAAPEGTVIIEMMRKILTDSEFKEVFKKWSKDTKDAAKEALQSQFDTGFESKLDARGKETNENILRRGTVASNTGEVDTAFLKDSKDKAIKVDLKPGEKAIDTGIKDEQGESIMISKDVDLAIEGHIKSLDSDGFKGLKNKESRMLAARHMTTQQVEKAGAISSANQDEIRNEIQRLIADPKVDAAIKESRKKVLEQMEQSMAWGGRLKISPSPNQVDLSQTEPGSPKPEKPRLTTDTSQDTFERERLGEKERRQEERRRKTKAEE